MFSKVQSGLSAGVAIFLLTVGFAHAAMNADEAIRARRTCMEEGHGGIMKSAVPMLKAQAPFDAAALKAAFDRQDATCKDWSLWWGEGTQKGDKKKTYALPAIWTDAKAFAAAANALDEADQNLRKATDLASLKAAFPAFGKSCQSCHEKFRAPLQ